jgi:two-component system response regulator AtoC
MHVVKNSIKLYFIKVTETASKTILVVDDDDDLRDALQWYFNNIGYQVLCASSGDSALPMVRDAHIDLVVSDIRMPNGDGIHLLKNIRALGTLAPPVILVSAYSEMDETTASAAGAFAFFAKPLDLDALKNSVRRAI